jgi:hypothetical protein
MHRRDGRHGDCECKIDRKILPVAGRRGVAVMGTTGSRALVAFSFTAAAAALAGGAAAWHAARLVERGLAAPAREVAPPAAAPATTLDLLKSADAAAAQGDSRTAAALYEEALASPLAVKDRLAGQLGLARARAALGDGASARNLLRVALAATGRPEEPGELVALGEAALRSGEPRDARRLFYSALALERHAPDETAKTALARAAIGIGETYRAEEGEATPESPPRPEAGGTAALDAGMEREIWTAWLRDVDPNAAPTASVAEEAGRRVATVRADRADALSLLALLAERSGKKLALPERPTREPGAAESNVAVTADFARVPLEVAERILAGTAGLEIAASTSAELALEAPPLARGPEGAARARAHAEAAFLAALRWTGVDASKAHLELAELARSSGRFEDAVREYHVAIAGAARGAEPARALLGLARSEAALFRFARSREPLFGLVERRDAAELAPQALMLIVDSYLGEGRDADAEKALRHLVTSFPKAREVPAAHLRLGRALLAESALGEALEEMRKAASTSPEPAVVTEARTAEARILLRLGQTGEARATIAALLTGEDGRTAEAYFLYAQLLHDHDDHLAALFALKQVRKRFPESAEARQATALAPREQVELGLVRDAAESLRDLESVPGDHAAVLEERSLEIARAWLGAGEAGRARGQLDRVLAATKTPAAAVVLLAARCDAALGDHRACLATLALLEGRVLPPDVQTEVARRAGDAEAALGNAARAIDAYRTGTARRDSP